MLAPIYALPIAGMMFLVGGLVWMLAGRGAELAEPGMVIFAVILALALQFGAVALLLGAGL